MGTPIEGSAAPSLDTSPPTPKPRARWSDLTSAQLLEIRQESPRVFDRLLAEHRRSVGR